MPNGLKIDRPLRTLFYGVTHEHAFGKLATLAKLRDLFEIVAVVDDRPFATRPVFADHPASADGLPVMSEEEALARQVDVAFVETTNADLMSVASRLVDRGIPMHCDKPCGERMEPYRSLVERCRVANLPFQIGYMYRGNPALQWIWREVRSGLIGHVSFIEADMNHDYQLEGYTEYTGSFKGGILYNLGCHLVDMVYPLVEGGFVSSIPLIGEAPGDPPGAKTAAKALVRFEGTDVLLRTSSRMPGGIDCRRLRIDGTGGTIDLCPIERFDGMELKVALSVKGRPPREVSFGAQTDRYEVQLRDLAAIVRGEKLNDQDYDRDLKVHELLLKVCGIL